MKSALTLCVLAAALALTACTSTESVKAHGVAQAMRDDPALRARADRDCRRNLNSKSLAWREEMAARAGVRIADVAAIVCKRTNDAFSSGRISASQMQALRDGRDPELYERVIQGKV